MGVPSGAPHRGDVGAVLAFRLHNISRDEGARACKVRLFFVGQLLLSSGVFCEGPQVDQASVYSFEYFLARRNCRPTLWCWRARIAHWSLAQGLSLRTASSAVYERGTSGLLGAA